jgi:hypothetical protein
VIAMVSDYLVVRDLGSTNGVRVNGSRVLEGRLKPGDEVTIGSLVYHVRWDPKSGVVMQNPTRPKPLVAEPLEDIDLESCEFPVALPEPAKHINAPPSSRPIHEPEKKAPPEIRKDKFPEFSCSEFFPENPGLVPLSDSFHGVQPEAPRDS